jgi:hypothetical protein
MCWVGYARGLLSSWDLQKWVAEVLVTLVVSWEVFVRSTITGLSLGTACSGDAKVGGPFSSGAVRLVMSLIA